MKRNNITFALTLLLGCICSACIGGNKTNKGQQTADTIVMAKTPVFNADSAFAFMEAQCAFGPRVPNTEAHRKCGQYIADQFKQYGATITDQYANVRAFNGKVLRARNIIATINPEATYRMLLCAHWDCRPWADNDPLPENHRKPVMGANDAASGVGVMLEIARLIQTQPINIGIDFICFDAEDYGVPQWNEQIEYSAESWCLGSQYWASEPHLYGYKAHFGILLDMVGGKGCTFSKEGYSIQYASQIVNLVWDTAHQLGYGSFFPMREGGYITDDHVPVNVMARIPCIDIVPYFTDGPSGFGPTWHTVNDTMENIDKNVLKAVGQTVLQVIYNMNR